MRDELEKLIIELKAVLANKGDRAAFHQLLLEGIRLLDLTDEAIAGRFDASRPTITRWRNGTNAPHAALRPSVYEWMLEQAAGRLTRLKRAEQQQAELAQSSGSSTRSSQSFPMAAKSPK